MRIWGIVMSLCLLLAADGLSQRFGAGAVIGLNASQIAGDRLAGFDKVGITGGLRGTAFLTDKVHLNVEFLYNEKGSKPDIFNNLTDPDINITLRYVEMPVYVTLQDWWDEEKGFHKAFGVAGFSVGRLLEASTFDHHNPDDINLDTLVPFFNESDVSWLLGFGFRLSDHIAVSFRYTRSINLLLNATKNELDTFSMRAYFLSFRGEYIF